MYLPQLPQGLRAELLWWDHSELFSKLSMYQNNLGGLLKHMVKPHHQGLCFLDAKEVWEFTFLMCFQVKIMILLQGCTSRGKQWQFLTQPEVFLQAHAGSILSLLYPLNFLYVLFLYSKRMLVHHYNQCVVLENYYIEI